MAEGRRQFDEAGRGADALQRLDDAPRLGGRIEPVGIEADQSEAHILRPREGPCEGAAVRFGQVKIIHRRSEEHTSELQSLMRISYAVFCLQKKKNNIKKT